MLARRLTRRANWAHSRSFAIKRRFLATAPESLTSKTTRRTILAAKYSAFFCASTVVGLGALWSGLLLHDSFTYADRHVERVPVSPLALHPETGGPKNLPVAQVYVDDEEDEENIKLAHKPRLVIVGGGWGAVAVLQTMNVGDYHVTVVSPETFTCFTPLLPSAAVGTVQARSLMESLRKVIARVRGHFVAGKAVDLVMGERLLEVEANENGYKKNFYIPYDKLVIACGSVSSTHGVPGLENCFQLKTIQDSLAIRRRLLDNFETASLPTTDPEERKRLLSFVVCGGGPTGVETAAELYDLCQEDVMNYFPKICREEVSIHVIQSREHILNTYSAAISNYAEKKFSRDGVDLITTARVASVHPDHVTYTIRTPEGNVEERSIPSNFVLWSTGIAMNPFTSRVSSLLPNQVHKKAIEVDSHLRVKGAPLGTVYAVGDCSTIETSLSSYLLQMIDDADRDEDGKISYEEWETMVPQIKKRLPLASKHLMQVRQLFNQFDRNKDNSLSINEVAELFQEISNKATALPATAQVASQQGKYLGKKLSKIASSHSTLADNDIPDMDEAVSDPFKYHHLGSLAYVGNSAVFDFGEYTFMGGLAAMYAWRSIYWSEQVSYRTRALLMVDWIIRGIWGRDLSRL